MENERDDLVPIEASLVAGEEMTDAEMEDLPGGLTMIKNANCQSSKGALNSVVTVEASLKL